MQQQQKGNKEASRVILASGSPRRKALLEQMGIEPDVQVMGIDESPLPGEEAQRYVSRVSTHKAQAAAELVGASAAHGRYIIAADTAVVCAGTVLGKPADFTEATSFWRRLSGTQHTVLTQVALWHAGTISGVLSQSTVAFGEIPEENFARYWASGEPLDKAGGYAIQGQAAAWVERIEGSYTGIMGLPLFETRALLLAAGLKGLL